MLIFEKNVLPWILVYTVAEVVAVWRGDVALPNVSLQRYIKGGRKETKSFGSKNTNIANVLRLQQKTYKTCLESCRNTLEPTAGLKYL